MCSARHLRLSTSEISDVTASMPSLDIQKYPPVARWISLFKVSSALTVISVRAVLAQAVLVEKLLLHSSGGRSYRQRMVVHERNLL